MAFDPLYLEPGDLRNAITIQAPSTTRDITGQPSQTWTTIITTRAFIRNLTIRETIQDNQLVSQSSHLVRMRYPGSTTRIVTGQRLLSGTDVYLIQGVTNVLNRNRVLELTALIVDGDSN